MFLKLKIYGFCEALLLTNLLFTCYIGLKKNSKTAFLMHKPLLLADIFSLLDKNCFVNR